MPNSRYLKGYRAELLAKKELEASGYKVLRTAGSHGFCDLICFDVNHVKFVQVKSVKEFKEHMYNAEYEKLKALKRTMPMNSRIELWIRYESRFKKVTVLDD